MSVQSPEKPMSLPDDEDKSYWPSLEQLSSVPVDAELVTDLSTSESEDSSRTLQVAEPSVPVASPETSEPKTIPARTYRRATRPVTTINAPEETPKELTNESEKTSSENDDSKDEDSSGEPASAPDDQTTQPESKPRKAAKRPSNPGMSRKERLQHELSDYLEPWLDENRPPMISEEEWQKLSFVEKNSIVDDYAKLNESEGQYVGRHRAGNTLNEQPTDPTKSSAFSLAADIPLGTIFTLKQDTAETGEPQSALDPEVEALADEKIRSIPRKVWDDLDAEAQERVIAQIYANAEREKWLNDNRPDNVELAAWSTLDLAAKERVYQKSLELKAEAEATELVTEPQQSVWLRAKQLAQKWTQHAKPVEVKHDTQSAKREVFVRRRRILVGALAAALATTAVFAPKNTSEEAPRNNVTSSAEAMAAGAAAVAGQAADALHEAASKLKAEQAKAAKAKAAQEAAKKAVQKTVTIKAGDTVWETAEMQLKAKGNKQPTVKQIDALKDHLLKINGLTEKTAKQIQPGTKLKV